MIGLNLLHISFICMKYSTILYPTRNVEEILGYVTLLWKVERVCRKSHFWSSDAWDGLGQEANEGMHVDIAMKSQSSFKMCAWMFCHHNCHMYDLENMHIRIEPMIIVHDEYGMYVLPHPLLR